MAEYTTSVDIANKALQHLGAPLIATLADNSKNAVQMNFAYDKCRQAELRSHVWQFSIAYSTLAAASPATQAFQNGAVRNRFTLPANYVRMAQQDPHTAGVSNQNVTAGLQWSDYSVEGTILLTANPSVLLRYASDITTVTAFDALFDEALAARLAFDTCEVITQNLQKRGQMAQIYAERIAMAQTLNLIETAADEPTELEAMFSRINQNPNGPVQPQQGGGRGQR
jgi:hypothetical protein